jgi:putative tryptophan/tyrosine transport system substrate-binding protein
MRRREFITAMGGAVAVAAWPFVARAQQAWPVIGFLHSGSPGPNSNRLAGFRRGLRNAGFVEGQNVTIEFRWAEDRNDRLQELAADLVRRKVNVITTLSATQAALAAKAATTAIPQVFQVGSDPVAIGLVSSLNKPGGNATGISSLAAEIMPKRIGLLRELVPSIANVFVLANPTNPNTKIMAAELQEVSRSQNVQGQMLHARNDEEIQAAFKQMVQKPSRALVIGNDPAFFIRRTQLATLAVSHRVPMIGYEREFVTDGGLMSYGPNSGKAWEMAGGYVARILKGERAGDLPVTQVAAFELVLNLKTAKALGLAPSPTVLALADEVIE